MSVPYYVHLLSLFPHFYFTFISVSKRKSRMQHTGLIFNYYLLLFVFFPKKITRKISIVR